MITLFAICLAYLIGSICSAVIVARIFDLPNPATEGSNNPGATNVLRLAGKKYALIVLLADMGKGLLPVLVAKLFGMSPNSLAWIGFAAVFGHMYPIFFKFHGGKGVATALGAILGLNFILGAASVAVWLLVARFFGYSSLASIIAILFAALFSLSAFHGPQVFMPLMSIFIFVLFKHHQNLTRLFDGKEPKIDLKLHRHKVQKKA